jgi:hypothetical protein
MRLIPFRGPKKQIKKTTKFITQWRELQGLCRDPKNWPEALVAADQLLDKALKKRKFKGKTMGERLVAAQRFITDNDDIWDAHNLVKKLRGTPSMKLKETDVKEALISFREALKDVGALQNGKAQAGDGK